MNISIQALTPKIFIIRKHLSNGVYGNAYVASCVVQLQGNIAWIYAFTSTIPNSFISEKELLFDFLKEKGISSIKWERYKKGKLVFRSITL